MNAMHDCLIISAYLTLPYLLERNGGISDIHFGTRVFFKNILDKNIEAQNGPKIKKAGSVSPTLLKKGTILI